MVEFPIHNSKYFDVREWVDPKVWNMLGPKAAQQIDPRIVRVADAVRELSGRGVMVNNWHYAKPGQKIYHSSGFRAKWDTTGSVLSQHRRGCAADLKTSGMQPGEALEIINANQELFLGLGLTTIENLSFTPSWLHLDCRPITEDIAGFLIVDP